MRKIIEYFFELKNITPLKYANEEEEGLKEDTRGNLRMFGSSVAGVLKSKLSSDLLGKEGSKQGEFIESKLMISDLKICEFDKKDLILRDGIKIDSKTGTTALGGKYTVKLVPKNCDFELFIRGEDLNEEDEEKMNQLIKQINNGINTGSIKFGGETNKGFGKFIIKKVCSLSFDLSNIEEREKYFKYLLLNESEKKARFIEKEYKDLRLGSIDLKNSTQVLVKFNGILENGIFIRGESKKEEQKTYILSYEESDKYIIPAGTIKGSIRAYCEKILNTLEYIEKENILKVMFGDENQKGILTFCDSEIFRENHLKNVYNRIKIDRFTGGVIDGALVNEERLIPDSYIEIKIDYNSKSLVAEQKKEIDKLLLLYFRDLSMGKISIGGNYSIGSGRFKEGVLEYSSLGLIKFNNIDDNIKIKIKEIFGSGR